MAPYQWPLNNYCIRTRVSLLKPLHSSGSGSGFSASPIQRVSASLASPLSRMWVGFLLQLSLDPDCHLDAGDRNTQFTLPFVFCSSLVRRLQLIFLHYSIQASHIWVVTKLGLCLCLCLCGNSGGGGLYVIYKQIRPLITSLMLIW